MLNFERLEFLVIVIINIIKGNRVNINFCEFFFKLYCGRVEF